MKHHVHGMWRWSVIALFAVLGIVATSSFEVVVAQDTECGTIMGDYGDAPDSLRQPPEPGEMDYPSLCEDDAFIVHRDPVSGFYIGDGVDAELNARVDDLDEFDDGVHDIGSIIECSLWTVTVEVTVPEGSDADEIYLNVATDTVNRNNRFGDIGSCLGLNGPIHISEWAVQNYQVPQNRIAPGESTLLRLNIYIGSATGPSFARFTLCEKPFEPPTGQWSGQGDCVHGETSDFLICVLEVGQPPSPGCPRMAEGHVRLFIPAVADDAAVTNEDAPITISVLPNDPGMDRVIQWTQPQHGSVTCTENGQCEYTPDPNFNGTDVFFYTACNEAGTDCGTARVTITVNPVNDPPVAVNDAATTDEDTPITIPVLPNDTDPDGDTLSVTNVTDPLNGSVVCTTTCTYTPDLNYNGPDSFTYTISDGNGGTDTATVTVTVNAVNDPPVAVDDTVTTDEDMPVTIDVLPNDTDVDGDLLTITGNTSPMNGSVVCTTTCVYTPIPNFNGTDSFEYTVSDGNGGTDTATVTITVSPVNDPPVAVGDTTATDEDTPVIIDVLSNDTDLDGDMLTIISNTNPTDGSVTCNTVCTYVPDPNFNGTDSFEYTISDGNGGTDTATVTVTVNAVNDPPVAENDGVTTDEDTSVNIDVRANDTDPDNDPLTIVGNTDPTNGSVVCTTACTYTPDPNFNGTDSFEYTVSDGSGGTDTATVTITVSPVNDPPVAVDDAYETDEDTPLSVALPGVLLNDTDIDGDLLSGVFLTGVSDGALSFGSDGSFLYTPDPNFNGTDSFTYEACDPDGLCDAATVTITVNPVNDPPVAVDDTTATDEDVPVTIDVLTNDTDPEGDPLTITGSTNPSNGSVVCTTTCTYTPDPNYNGPDSFIYTISDGNGGTDTATVTVTVNPVNDPPVAVDDHVTLDEDTSAIISVLTNDTDPDGDTLTIVSNTDVSHGDVTCTATTCTYTPEPNYNGLDSFTYTISDGAGGTDTATVFLTVDSVNDPPVAVNDAYSTNEDTLLVVVLPGVLVNDTDPDGDSLDAVLLTDVSHGTLSLGSDGSVNYNPDPNYHGLDSFTYEACDPGDLCDTATVTITIDPVNDPPVAVDDTATTDEDVPVVVDVLANDTDLDGDSLTIISNTNPTNGSVVCTTTCTYTPDPNYNGPDSFTYTISDGNGGTDTATVTVTVNDVNDPPVAEANGPYSGLTSASIPLSSAGSNDPDGTIVLYEWDLDDNGSFETVGANPSFRSATSGTFTVTLRVTDDNGATDTDTATVVVDEPPNQPPFAEANGPYTCTEGGTALLSSAGSNDPDGTIELYEWDLDNNGSFETVGASPSFNCSTSGTFTVKLRVTDDDSDTATDTATVTVTPSSKSVKISWCDSSNASTNQVPVQTDDVFNVAVDGTVKKTGPQAGCGAPASITLSLLTGSHTVEFCFVEELIVPEGDPSDIGPVTYWIEVEGVPLLGHNGVQIVLSPVGACTGEIPFNV